MRLVLMLALFVAGGVLAADWPRFRGPNGLGTSDQAIPLQWSASSGLLWKTPLPGQGNGSPIIVKNKIFLQSASTNGAERLLVRLDAVTGEIEWTKSRGGKKAHAHKKNSLASSTPASDGERIYCIVWDGDNVLLTATTFDGEDLWTKPLGGYVSQHGVGMSPVVVGKNVYVNYDQDGQAEFLCFDGKTGDKRWSAPRKAFRACYSSPIVREVNGKTEIINASTAGITAYDPDTGNMKWDWVWKFDGMALRTVGSPILVGDTLIAVSGDGGGSRSTVALKLGGEEPKLLWEKKRECPYVPGPLVLGEHLYWVTDGGIAMCVEVATGKIIWNERIFPKAVSASPILVHGQVVALAEDGKAVIFPATPKGYEKLAENSLPGNYYASPATVDGKLFLRSDTHLYCMGKK
jgi:outer membrane protein assembly factor BamB